MYIYPQKNSRRFFDVFVIVQEAIGLLSHIVKFNLFIRHKGSHSGRYDYPKKIVFYEKHRIIYYRIFGLGESGQNITMK